MENFKWKKKEKNIKHEVPFFIASFFKKKERKKDTYVKIHVFFYLPIQVFMSTFIFIFLKVFQETQTEILLQPDRRAASPQSFHLNPE